MGPHDDDKESRGVFKDLYHSYFSPQSGRAMKLSYFVMVMVVGAYTIICLLDGVVDTCAYGRNRSAKDSEVKFLNPEFDPENGCLRRRFWFLGLLTPEECMLCRRILMSVVLGMMIGFERRRADRPAGVRTMALVSLGSCIFTIDSMFAFSSSPDTWDSSRVAAAIPSGVGFLGGGLIFKRPPSNANDRHEVHGLTTASSVWLSAAVGIAAGGGLAVIAFFSTMVMIIVLRFGPRLPLDEGHPRDIEDHHYDDDDDDDHKGPGPGDDDKYRRTSKISFALERSKVGPASKDGEHDPLVNDGTSTSGHTSASGTSSRYNAINSPSHLATLSRKPSLRE